MGARVLIAGGGTGGHLYPALNLAAALRRTEPEVALLYVGASRGLEADVLPNRGLPYRLVPAQPVYRSRPWRNWRLAATAPSVALGTARAFHTFRPDLVVGTGGYAAAPALAWGILTGRATALQEQNARPGWVTRLFARWVDQLHLGFPEAERVLSPGGRTEVFALGNPVAIEPPETQTRYPWPGGRVILVAGGSQGARGLNERLLADLAAGPEWPEGTSLVWIAGRAHAAAVAERAKRFPRAEQIRVVPYIEDLGGQLGRVSLAIGRAGAMFVSELAAWGVPAVLVPFPGAADAHQSANASVLEEAGAAVVREEEDLGPGELWDLAASIVADEPRRARMSKSARERGAPDAADRIARELLRLARGGGARAGDAPGRRGFPDPGSGDEG